MSLTLLGILVRHKLGTEISNLGDSSKSQVSQEI